MNRTLATMLKGILCVGALTMFLTATPAQAQIRIEVSPPFWFIATASPVYFDGHATYWYGDHWYYRDGGAWRYYNDEPSHLRDYRGHHEFGRQYYGRAHGGGFRHR